MVKERTSALEKVMLGLRERYFRFGLGQFRTVRMQQ